MKSMAHQRRCVIGLVLSIVCDKCHSNDEKMFKEDESIEILNILNLINNMNE